MDASRIQKLKTFALYTMMGNCPSWYKGCDSCYQVSILLKMPIYQDMSCRFPNTSLAAERPLSAAGKPA